MMGELEYQQILKQYMDDPTITGRSHKPPWADITNQDQVNVSILSVDEEASVFTRLVPEWKVLKIAVRAMDEEGTAISQDGKFLYDEKELPVLKKIKPTQITLPFRFFTSDIPKSNLGHREMKILSRLFSTAYKLMQKQIMEPGTDYTGTLLYLHGRINQIVITSRGLNAAGLQWAKTSATYSGTIQQTIEQQKFMDQLQRLPGLDEKTKEKVRLAWANDKNLGKIADFGGSYYAGLEKEGQMLQRNTGGWQNNLGGDNWWR